jgi:raffinose/stachyose/melibiose transport system permease protein
VLASLLSQRWLRGALVYRTLLFLPQVLPMVLIGVIWRWMYHPIFGPINESLRAVGLGALARPWLGDFDWALASVGFVASWYFYGFCMVVFVAGIQKIDQSLFDAARVDGANELQQFLHVTIPGLRREIFVVLTFTFIAALKVFDLVFVTTRGGPGNETLVASLYLYRNAFQQNLVGYGAAVAVVITVVVVVIALLLRRWQEAGE